ncbi:MULTISPECIES: DUF4395 domain-containing protein [Microbacterium]|uniref:DUF4395 domain-containing protein n=1 Tax=Microbacterium TaxID=33882 RepID=UPI00051A046E|nr:DUF4395 domain-containing protein [Microbacterium profundi]
MTAPAGIDPRGPRFAASITATLLLIALVLSLIGISTARADATWFAYQPLADAVFVPDTSGWALPASALAQRALDPGFLLLVVIALLFLWGVLSPRTAPWGVLFRRAVRPRLTPPTESEDPRPPRFAQGVGLFVVGIGLVLHLAGVPWALPVAAGAAFIAAFLNAAFDFCLGCQIYLVLQRAGIIGRAAAA